MCAPTGQPLALFNSEGKVQWQKGPTSLWGVALGPNDAPHHDPGLGFAGQQWDEESGLFYNRHRFYLPEAACYLSPDPLGLAGGENTYSYVSNPQSWIDPLGLSRCTPGTASGNGSSINGKWLKGTHGNAGLFPKSIADKLRGRYFRSFDDFREAFWKEVSKDPHLPGQFIRSNRTRMEDGKAPIAHSSQSNGKNKSYVLHHRTPIQHGGGVYDVDNLIIVTPRYHLDILSRDYHFGGML